MTYTIVQGNYGFDFPITVTDDAGTALNLTGATIHFHMRKLDSTTNKVDNGVCVIDVAANGTCHYPFVAADTDTVGEYAWQVEVTYSAPAKVLTSVGDANIEIVAKY